MRASYHFGDFEFEPSQGRLTRGSRDINLQPKVSALLSVLLKNKGDIVERDELMRLVWPDVHVNDDALGQAVRKLRRALGEAPKTPRFIFTVPKRGYRFTSDVEVRVAEQSNRRLHPRQPDSLKTNLTSRLTTFVGREAELTAIREHFGQATPLLTLLGTAGAGKTRLAQQFGARHLQDYPGGVWFSDLTETRNAEDISNALGAAMSVPLTQPDSVEQLGEVIRGRGRVLIILDNFEQIVECAPSTVGAWLQKGREAHFLVTSRTRLALEGEQGMFVEPLPQGAAVRLFLDRVHAVQPDFVVTDSNRPMIVRIVDHLDSLPLAIELAAARMGIFTPESMLKRLPERFSLLRGHRRDLSARQATLENAISWSWNLLTPLEKVAFSQCSKFHGGFTLDAAEAVLDIGNWPEAPSAMDIVQRLSDHSLVVAFEPLTGQKRFFMYESVREFAASKLSQDGAAVFPDGSSATGPEQAGTIGIRHCRYYASFGDDAFLDALDTQGGERRRTLQLEMENLLTAVAEAIAHGESTAAARACLAVTHLRERTGPFLATADLAERVLSIPGVEVPERLRLNGAKGWALHWGGQKDEALAVLMEALEGAREALDSRLEGIFLYYLLTAYWIHGQPHDAKQFGELALVRNRETGNRRVEGRSHTLLGFIDWIIGRIPDARQHYEEALKIHSEIEDRSAGGLALVGLGILNLVQGRMDEARAHYEAAVDALREAGDRKFEGWALSHKGDFHFIMSEEASARECLEEALFILREVGERHWEGFVLARMGELALLHDRFEEAKEVLERGFELIQKTGYIIAEGSCANALGELWRRLGEGDKAREYFERSENIIRLFGIKPDLCLLLCRRGHLNLQEGSPKDARAALYEAMALAEEMNDKPGSTLHKAIAGLKEAMAGLGNAAE